MAKRSDRPVRVEYLGSLRGDVQLLELRITTPAALLINTWEIGQLAHDDGAELTLAQEKFARAALCIEQRKAVAHAHAALRGHFQRVRYIRTIERLSADIMPRVKDNARPAQAAELVRKAR